MRTLFLIAVFFLSLFTFSLAEDKSPMNSSTFSGLKFRSIGPALASGRIGDLAVNPDNPSHFYVAVASGGVWRTYNAGTTFEPIFDNEGSYSIGCITMDPNNPLNLWVGTGENNSQRSVSYGDGVYKSIDGGTSWTHMGLKNSQHIAKILVDPRDSNTIYVASQGPLWNSGGERGLYKSTDGGKNWKNVIEVDEHTGVTDILFDPRNPDIIYAATYQRQRRVWTLLNGGPGSGLHKSVDGGKSWKKLSKGLPKGEIGRIGLAVSPVNPDVVYAIVEATPEEKGFYRSTDAGENWKKMSNHISRSPQYYQEIICDPVDVNRVYSMDTWMMVTLDGGKTWKQVGEKYKHVDNHALWINPKQPDYMLAGCDGGVYETFDKGATWKFFDNLPVTQFYKVTVDNDAPFYNVYAGTQDNATLGGPSRNTSINGIRNADWFVTVFGDGFETQVDPTDPNIIYSQYQYGGLVRFDKKSGEMVSIQPQADKGAPALRWNWDSALKISPHNNQRLYFGANILFRSDDRGNSWKAVSPDLTRQIDRNKLKIMDKVWSIDAIAKNKSTSFFGNIVSFDESPLKEGLLYVGTDDGLIQVSENGGTNWKKIAEFSGVPGMSYVSHIQVSLHKEKVVYATFDNHKKGDFKPYVLKSTNNGNSWTSISGNLPERGTVYTIAEDHVNPDLLFVGTEFGVFFTIDGGKDWIQLKGGLPTIAVFDIDIQRRESDLVLGTFGRGIYILDDYSPLRQINNKELDAGAKTFPVKKSWMFIESAPLGLAKKSMQGDNYYIAENPPVGAVFNYYLKESLKSLKEIRQEKEKKQKDDFYPSWDALEKEKKEEKPSVILTIRDEANQIVRRIEGSSKSGIHRVSWDMRYPESAPVNLKPRARSVFDSGPLAPLAAPGNYTMTLEKKVKGVYTELGQKQTFECVPLNNTTLPALNKKEVLAFQKKTARMQRAIWGSGQVVREIDSRIKHLKKGLFDTPARIKELQNEIKSLEEKIAEIKLGLSGNSVIRGHSEPVPPSINNRINEIIYGAWASTSEITETHKKNYKIAGEEFTPVLAKLKSALKDLEMIEQKAEVIGTPITPGRVPDWKME
ncbi:MAG: glycosyl hydrolase [Calditrichaeota bacterium]|nr:MAG: glycosyl hydrolase [Calditrichota bacterium]MBL1204342.1 glycosyl hydrolase [Calditrichota bacterium]NOG44171.1 glycosyl hydrolase [Calditrichota bacterium]